MRKLKAEKIQNLVIVGTKPSIA